MEQYPLNIKFLKKKFNPKILINFRDSLKVSLSLMLPQQTEESAVGTMCPPHGIGSLHICIFPLYQIAIAAFQLSYQMGLLFPLHYSLFSMIIISNSSWTLRF